MNMKRWKRNCSILLVVVLLVTCCLLSNGCQVMDPKQTEGPKADETIETTVDQQENITDESQEIRETEKTSDAQTMKPSDRLDQDKNQKDESEDEGSLPELDEELLARLNTYPQADQDTLEYFDRLFEDPYYLAFITSDDTDADKGAVRCINVMEYGELLHAIYQYRSGSGWGEILMQGNGSNGYQLVKNQYYDSDDFGELYAPEGFYATAVKNMDKQRATWFQGMLNVDRPSWFEDYQGGVLEVMDGIYESPYGHPEGEPFYWYESPMYCNDIVYYRPEGEETIDQIAVTMMEAMVDRMTVPSDVRPFIISKYQIVEKQVNSVEITLRELWQRYRIQTLRYGELETWQEFLKWAITSDGQAPIGEDMWFFIPRGNYAFEGAGLLGMTMEDEIQMWPEGYRDGMIPFQAQGGNSVFLFILMKDEDVYRLQRANGMRQMIE